MTTTTTTRTCQALHERTWRLDSARRCPFCGLLRQELAGQVLAPDLADIRRRIAGRGGRALRTSAPAHGTTEGLAGIRAYYVWRMARFHGGVDVCMPVMAGVLAQGDPWLDVLDRLADEVAVEAYGTSLGAVRRWAPLLGLGR